MKKLTKKIVAVVAILMITAMLGTSLLAIFGSFASAQTVYIVEGNEEAALASPSALTSVSNANYAAATTYATNADIVGFSTLERCIYNALRNFAAEVANGDRISTTVSVTTGLESLTWTQSQLGCTLVSNGNITTSAYNAVARKVKSVVNFEKIYQTLLAELPYELYWHDKTVGYTCSYKLSGNSSYMSVVEIEFSFAVSSDYRNPSSSSKYAVASPDIAYATATVPFAKSIVQKYSHLSDEEKLFAYANEICSLVEYNHAATEPGVAYGDPWQLIYVFDNNPNTNIVCEGYAKAFKFLCDLTAFEGDVKCYIAFGTYQATSYSGLHMWNVVSVDASNYLVDVTMLDYGSEASKNDVFLLTGTSEDNNRSHVVSWGKGASIITATYIYHENQYGLYSNGYLVLSEPAPHIHEFNSQIHSDANYHWRYCECGAQSPLEPHDTSLYPATCMRPAICSGCGSYVGGFTTHTYTEENTSATYLLKEATCTSAAVYYYSCQCGKKGNTTFTSGAILEHVYDNRIVKDIYLVAEATCTSKAIYYYSCYCGAHGDATFETGAYKKHVYDQQNTDEKYMITAGTCNVPAMYLHSCQCGAKGGETFVVNAPSHAFDDSGVCTLCGANANDVPDNNFGDVDNPGDDEFDDTDTDVDYERVDDVTSSPTINPNYLNNNYSFLQFLIELLIMIFKNMLGV